MTPAALTMPGSIATLGNKPFTATVEVNADDLSASVPHANNVQYLRWVDRIAELHLDSQGHTRAAMAIQGRMWFVARHEVDYLAEAFAGDLLGVATWISSVGKTTQVRETVVWQLTSGVIACRATSRWAHIDLKSRRPSRPPPP